jgi:hypothetical protein
LAWLANATENDRVFARRDYWSLDRATGDLETHTVAVARERPKKGMPSLINPFWVIIASSFWVIVREQPWMSQYRGNQHGQ